MDRRGMLSLALLPAAGAIGGLAGCGNGPGSGGTTTVRIGDDVAADNPEVTAENYFGTQLKSLTSGKYVVKVFPNATLGDSNRMNEQVRSGRCRRAR